MYLFIVTDWSKVKKNASWVVYQLDSPSFRNFKSLLGFSYITRENEARFLIDL